MNASAGTTKLMELSVRGTLSEPSQTVSHPGPSTAAARPTSATAADHYSSPAVGRPLNPTARPFIPRTHHRSHPSPSVDTEGFRSLLFVSFSCLRPTSLRFRP